MYLLRFKSHQVCAFQFLMCHEAAADNLECVVRDGGLGCPGSPDFLLVNRFSRFPIRQALFGLV